MEQYGAWDLFRRGHLDQERHLKILRDIIRKNMTDLVSHGKIITGDNVVIPVTHLKQYKFVYEDPGGAGTIMLDKKMEKGDTIGKKPQKSKGQSSSGDSSESEEGFYEVVVNADQIAEILFQDLELPELKEKQKAIGYKEEVVREGTKKRGSISNLAKKKTIIQNIKRNAAKGDPGFKNIIDDDLRFDTNVLKRVPHDRVAVIFIRDRSGSMDATKKHLSRVMAFWIIKFLESKYKKVTERSYIIFDTKAEEVDQEAFITRSEGGGTRISSGFQLADEIIAAKFPPESYNLYTFLFTDGDNNFNDNLQAREMVEKMAAVNNLAGIVHIRAQGAYSYYSDLRFINSIKELNKPNVIVAELTNQEDVMACMNAFFGRTKK